MEELLLLLLLFLLLLLLSLLLLYIYIYIYIICLFFLLLFLLLLLLLLLLLDMRPYFGAKYYTPEITRVKFHWKMPLNIHWTFPVRSTGKVTILWNTTENATENPR